jgi:hypothetical protein
MGTILLCILGLVFLATGIGLCVYAAVTRLKTIAIIGAAVILLAVGGTFAVLLSLDASAEKGYRRMATALDDGLADLGAVSASRPVFHGDPQEGNAWLHYERALTYVARDVIPGDPSFPPLPPQRKWKLRDIREKQRVEQSQAVADFAPALAMVEQGLLCRTVAKPLIPGRLLSNQCPSLLSVRQITRLLLWRSRQLSEAGKTEEALEDLLRAEAFGVDLMHGGTILEAAIGLSCLVTAVGRHAVLLEVHRGHPPHQTRTRQAAPRLVAHVPSLTRVLETESVLALEYYLHIYQLLSWFPRATLSDVDIYVRSDVVSEWEHFEKVRGRFHSLITRGAGAPWPEIQKHVDGTSLGKFSRTYFPVEQFTHNLTVRALLTCLWIQAACYLFERENGRLPETLAELVPDILPRVPPDPFLGSESKMRYRIASIKGRPLPFPYSVGSDGADDGGQDSERGKDVCIATRHW